VPWQLAQFALAGWCVAAESAGGLPWQLLQALKVPVTVVQTGVVPVPPLSALEPPWQ